MRVANGYKQTTAGVIPEDWEVKDLGEIAKISNGSGLLKGEIFEYGEVPAIPYTSLYTDFTEIIDPASIKWFVDQSNTGRIVSHPCVLIASSSNMEANTGKASAWTKALPVAVGREVIILRGDFDCAYLSYLLSTTPYRKRTLTLARGTTIKHVYATTFRDYSIAAPSLPEQRAIAAALSDVDELIGALDKLIAKKRAIKLATMQQLLTGKTRLPGFSGEWASTTLNEIGYFRGGNGFPTRVQGNQSGEYPFYKVSDMNNPGNEVFMRQSKNYVSETVRSSIGATAFPKGSIVFAKIGAAVFLERKRILRRSSCIDNNMMAMVVDEGVADVPYIHAVLTTIRFGDLVETTALPALGAKQLSSLQIALPPLDEQQALSKTLRDFDAEITALEQRRDKTKAIKQGTMQSLLTGRVRLVEPEGKP